MRPKTVVWRKIRQVFGAEVMTASGRIDRKRLGSIVFDQPKRLKQLTRIIHPAVRKMIYERIRELKKRRPKAVVVLDVPLLLEAETAYKVDAVVVVSASNRIAEERLRKRSEWTLKEIRRRRGLQLSLKEKKKMADFIVHNGGSLTATRRQVIQIWKKLVQGEN